jgi:hypothetical protein
MLTARATPPMKDKKPTHNEIGNLMAIWSSCVHVRPAPPPHLDEFVIFHLDRKSFRARLTCVRLSLGLVLLLLLLCHSTSSGFQRNSFHEPYTNEMPIRWPRVFRTQFPMKMKKELDFVFLFLFLLL